MQEVIIGSVSELVERLGDINRGKRALYRGQRRDVPLLPKIARLSTNLPILDAERAMLNDFKHRSVPYLEQQPENDWEWLAIMQHHGLATRLLDWSANPLASLWFTVNKPPAENQHGILWLFQPDSKDYALILKHDDPLKINNIFLVKPRLVTARIGAQLGWFTIHYFAPEKEKFVALEDDPTYIPRLVKLIIPPDKFARIRFDLDRIGVNSATLFPDLDGLCAHIEWEYSKLADETTPDIQKSFMLPSKID